MSNNNKRNISVVMMITVVSKCLGFLRDIVLAYFFGTSDVTDAFFVAQTIPEFLFSLVVQAISIGFIPIYVEIKEKKGQADANSFTNNVLKICLILCVALIVFVNLFTREIANIFASGFEGNKALLTVQFTRIIVFSMVFRIVVSVYSAFLNANGHFTKPALNGVILDVVSIISIVVASFTASSVLVYGIIIATALQFVVLLSSVARTKPMITFSLKGILNEDVRRMLKLFLPVIIGVGASQINVLADKTMASSIDGAIASLNYASKANYVLENVIILSLATVMFPLFSKNVATNDIAAFRNNVKKSVDIVSFTMIPCAFLLFLFPDTIIKILFERGAFNASSLESTSYATKYYSIGLVFLAYNAIVTRALYAMKKMNKVSYISCASVATNIVLNFVLKPLMGVGGLALATSISSVVAAVFLTLSLKTEFGTVMPMIEPELIKAVISSIVMSLAILLINRVFSLEHVWISFAIAVTLGGAIYLLAEIAQKSEPANELIRGLK